MATYQALYRKFRPSKFEEVKGQDSIVTTLKNQIINNRIGHAYLFCGTRGTGKTSMAKLFAKAVNCDNPQDGSPCGECQTCKNIGAGVSMNVIEMDAASNNSVDDIRQIVEEVAYSPTEGRYKVYIIDEAHMLTPSAYNALLKTLEEPPSYVIFILATTENHKIPITIHSRCQRYDFKRITIETMASRMKELMDIENITVQDRALQYIAKCADGSMRDALSLLERCVSFYLQEELTYDKAIEVLGAVDTEVYSSLLRSVIKNDIQGVISLLEELIMKGKDLSQFVSDFTWYIRNLLLMKTTQNAENLIDMSSENLERLKEESNEVEIESLMRYIRILSELSGEIKFSTQKRVLIEVALIKLCKPQMERDYESILERIRVLEEKSEKNSIDPVQIKKIIAEAGISASSMEIKEVKKVPLPKALPEDVKNVLTKWAEIASELDGVQKTYLDKSKPSVENDQLVLVFSNKTDEDYFVGLKGLEAFKETASKIMEKDIPVTTGSVIQGKEFEECFPDISELINFDIEIED